MSPAYGHSVMINVIKSRISRDKREVNDVERIFSLGHGFWAKSELYEFYKKNICFFNNLLSIDIRQII